MADRESTLDIKISPEAAKSGAKEVEVALGKVGAAATKAVGVAEKAAQAAGQSAGKGAAAAAAGGLNAIQALEGKLRTQQANLQKAVKAGLLTPEEAARAGRETGAAFAREMAKAYKGGQLAGLGEGGVFKAGGQAFVAFNGQLRSVSDYSKSAGQGLGMMRESVASLAAQMTGVHPVFGRLSTMLGTMAMGGALTVGLLAGLAAIGYGIGKLTEHTRKEKEETQKLIDKLRELRREREDPTAPQKADVAAMQAQVAELDRKLAIAQRNATAPDVTIAAKWEKEMVKLWRERTDAAKLLQEAQQQLTEAERDRLQKMREFREAGPEVIEEINKEATATKKLTEDTKELTRIEEYRQRMRLAAARSTVVGTTPRISGGTVTFAGAGEYSLEGEAAAAAANAQAAAAAKVMEETWTEAIRGIQQAMAQGFEEIFDSGLAGFKGFADAILNTFKRTAAQIAAALTSKALGLDDAIANLKKPKAEGGGLGAVAQGGAYAVAGAAVLNLVSAIIDVGQAAKEAARQMRALEAAVSKDIDDIYASLQPDSLAKRIDQALAPVRDAWDAVNAAANKHDKNWLVREMARLDEAQRLIVQKVTDEWNAALEEAAAAAAAAAEATRLAAEQEAALEAARKAASIEDLNVRLLMAEGRGAEAEAMRTQLERTRELAAAQSDEEKALLAQIYAAEDATAAALALAEAEAAAAAAAAEAARQRVSFMDDLGVRRAQLGGNEAEIIRARWAVQSRQELEAAEALLAAGTITQAMFDDLASVLNDELAAALAGVAQAATDAAAAAEAQAAANLAARNAALEDLKVRELIATGQEGAAADERFRLEQQRELAKAITDGLGDAYIAELKRVQALEAEARVVAAAAASAPVLETVSAVAAGEDRVRGEVIRSVTGVTETSALRLVDVGVAQLTVLRSIEANTRVGGAGGTGPRFTVSVAFNSAVTTADPLLLAKLVGAAVATQVNNILGAEAERDERADGVAA